MNLKIVWGIFFFLGFWAVQSWAAGSSDWSLPEREKLVFRVKWIGIPAGIITAEIKGIEEVRGRRAYRIEVTARTTGFCSTLYRIEDRYVSFLDVERRHTLRHEVHRREGHYQKDAVTDFDQELHKAYFRSLTDGSEKVFDIPPDTQDTIGAAYAARFLPLAVKDAPRIRICNSEKNYEILLNVTGRKKIATRMGRKEVVLLKPLGRINGQRVREGRLTGFVDTAPGHRPYQIVIKAPVFTQVTATLLPVREK